jgi:hypothetical protein
MIKQMVGEVATDTSGRWISIDEAHKLVELTVRECIDICENTRYDGQVAANRIKFVFGLEND